MLLGLCMSANCLGEVLVFYFSGWWLARLGVERALNLAAAAYALRLGAYTVGGCCSALPLPRQGLLGCGSLRSCLFALSAALPPALLAWRASYPRDHHWVKPGGY